MRTDADLFTELRAALDSRPDLAHADLVIEVKEGVVALGGHVSSYLGKLEVEAVARNIAGVRAIANDLEVKLGQPQRSDREIADAACHVLRSSVSVPTSAVTPIVKDAWVTLEGKVSAWYQRDAAETAVSALWGLKGVTNNIEVATASTGESR